MNHNKKIKLFNEMYKMYYPRLLRNISKFTYDYEEREDICQETFQRVWQALDAGKYEELAQPFTWIFKIAIGASQRLLENKQRQIPVHIDIDNLGQYDPPEETEDDESVFITDPEEFEGGLIDYNTPEAVLMREEAEAELDDQVNDLPEHYREIMALFYYDGLTYDEISERLGIPRNTVDTRLVRAREKIKTFLGEESDGELEGHEDSGEGSTLPHTRGSG